MVEKEVEQRVENLEAVMVRLEGTTDQVNLALIELLGLVRELQMKIVELEKSYELSGK